MVLALAGCDSILRLDPITPLAPSPRALVFDNRSSASDLAGFPVLVAVDPSTILYDTIADPSHDLRFHDEASGTDLPFEIERWDPSGESIVWVKVPVIHAGSTTDRVLMYFGPDAHGSESATAVWSDYELVFHGDSLVDSTGKSTPMMIPDTAGAMPSITRGLIGNAVAFAGGSNQRVEMMGSTAIMDHWPTYTIELCLAPAYMPDPYNLGVTVINGTTNPVEPFVIDKPGGALSNGRLRNSVENDRSPFVMQTDLSWDGTNTLNAIYYMPNQTWSQVTFAYDGQILWSYRDGTALAVNANDAAAPTPVDTAGENVQIGGTSGAAPLLGEIDEVRISRTFHDTSWVFAQYLSMTKHFVTIEAP